MGRAMMGMFRLLKEDKVVFYEFFRIAEENGSLVLRLKHFHSDLKGWEEKDAMVNLPLLKITPEEIVFDGMTFRKMGPDAVTVSVMIGGKSDKGYEVKFVYSRVKDAAEAAQLCGASAWCAIAMSDAATSVVSVPAVAALSAANSSR